MDEQTIQHLREKIQTLIEKFEKEMTQMEDATKPISPENSIGRISRMDAINNKSVMEASFRSKREKLAKLKMALKKVGEPGFGLCKHCGRTIQEGRLMFMPESDRCVKCADL
jgi:DnaK suppressor protein